MLLSTLPRSLSQCQRLRVLRTATSHRWYANLQRRQKWGVFSDIHFQLDDLPRIVASAEWITSVFRNAGVTQIFCLGDVLNTRESVNVQALSATVSFFDELRKIAPVHVVLGNHDMNLKHSARISSLDFLDIENAANVYREPKDVDVEGIRCLMVPWVENHQLVMERLAEISAAKKAETVMFGHLAISGAIQRLSLTETSRFRRHTGILKGKHLGGFKGVFLGHFHHHQRLDEKEPVWYVGAPMQHHFGDRGDDRRGILLVDPTSVDKFEFLRNPDWDVYREIDLETLSMDYSYGAGLPTDLRGKRINLRCGPVMAPDFEDWRKILMDAGVSDVRRKKEIGRPIQHPESSEVDKDASTSTPTELCETEATAISQESASFEGPSTETFIEALKPFLTSIEPQSDLVEPSEFEEYISTATEFMHRSASSEASPTSGSHLSTFSGTLNTLTISNFLSVEGTLTIPFSTLQPGTWFVTGPNGAGKSMIFEAIVWCLFGRTLRSDMTATDPINDVIRKNTAVRIDFDNGYSVERLRNFSSRGAPRKAAVKLYKNGQEVEDFERGEYAQTQEALERDVLGCDFDMFSKSVVFGDQGKGAGNFLTLEKNERREVLEELLGVGAFEGYLKTVKEARKMEEKERNELSTKVEWNKKEVARLEQDLKRHQSVIAPRTAQKEKIEADLEALAVEEAAFEKDKEGLDLARQETEIRKFNQLKDKASRLDVELQHAQRKLKEVETSLTNFGGKVQTGVCPTCQQPLVDTVHVDKRLAELGKEKESAQQRVGQLAFDQIKLGKELDAHTGAVSSIQNTRRLLEQAKSLSYRRTTLTSGLAKLTAELSFSETQVPDVMAGLKAVSSELQAATERLDILNRSLRILMFWETAFSKKPSTSSAPNMRHYLISTSIPELNELVSSHLSILAPDTPLPVSFTPDLALHPPSAFGKRSSGQRKRNNLAVLFALFQLTRQKSRFRADFVMLDEVFDALDSEGQQHAKELIECVTEEGDVKHVLVVTHSERMEDVARVGSGGNKVLKVKMTKRGTVVEDPDGNVRHEWDVDVEPVKKNRASKKEVPGGVEESKSTKRRTRKVKENHDVD